MFHSNSKRWTTILLVLFLAGSSAAIGCSGKKDTKEKTLDQSQKNATQIAALEVNGEKTFKSVSMITRQGVPMVPLEQVVKSLDYRSQMVGHRLAIGGTGEEFSVIPGSNKATIGSRTVILPQPLETQKNKDYISLPDIDRLFHTQTAFDAKSKTVWIKTLPEIKTKSLSAMPLKNVDENAVISYAKKFLGVDYQFATGPYEQTGKFDCSTYTQYVFKHFGVDIPRNSRQQARVGTPVSFNNMKAGDLVYFYVPGRFSSNRVVGHVGIYMGNNQMINTYQKGIGVTITDISKPYWKKTFLEARRYFN